MTVFEVKKQQMQRACVTGTHWPEMDETHRQITIRTTIVKDNVY